MTQLATALIDNEFKTYAEKTKEIEFKQIQLDDLFLNKTSGFSLINTIRKLIKKNFEFLKSIENKMVLTSTEEVLLSDIFEEVTNIITDHFEDKVKIMKTFHSRESYEKIMIFLMFLFEKFEIE